MKPRTNLILFLGVLLFLVLIDPSLASDPNENNIDVVESKNATKVIGLAESMLKSTNEERAQAIQQYWKEAFDEIKNLVVKSPQTSSEPARRDPLTQWKQFLEDDALLSLNTAEEEQKERKTGRPRFEGFASWERQLQLWKDEVAEYMERFQAENGEYPFSTYGIPKNATEAPEKGLASPESVDAIIKDENTLDDMVTTTKLQRPVPVPAQPGEPVLPHTDFKDKSKRILIVTTASLPWMTGTAVNPLLRAAYLTKGRAAKGGSVTLMLPWLERMSDQERVYGKDKAFKTQEEQEAYIRTWLRDTAGMPEASEQLQVIWYTAWLERAENSVYSMGDITALVSADDIDICILEEPEHLNWYRAPGESWTAKFEHVVGIIHTNYFAYAQDQPAALIRAPAMRLLSSWMIRAHCHRVIKLSGTLGKFAPDKELVENVHGVRGKFLQIGEEVKRTLMSKAGKNDPIFGPEADPTIYFIGKMLWSKGLGSLMELLKYAEESAGLKLKVDMYGGGPDKNAAGTRAAKLGLNMPFHGPIDHAELGGTHKIFINPSTTEVLCTTVAEALAMGKFVVLPSHPSNDFFAQFPNCLPYATKEEFVGNLYYALTHSPEPLTEEYSYALSWDAATERLEAAGCISVKEAKAMEEIHSSSEAGVEIDLPPLIEEERKKLIITTFRYTRERYRQFRSKLSQDIQQSNVLPKPLQRRMIAELDKRLDLDIDVILESPKLRLQLSPAELDKQLLDLYNKFSQSQGSDVVRVLGGGTNVGMQNLYMKRQARKQAQQNSQEDVDFDWPFPLPGFAEVDDVEEKERTTAQWVKLALRRNLPATKNTSFLPKVKKAPALRAKNEDSTKMCIGFPSSFRSSRQPLTAMKTIRLGSKPMKPPLSTKLSLLI